MRLLHTSDWHLGQQFFGHDRTAEHQLFLDWLLDTLEREAVDVLLIAGDIYDQAHPAAETQRQFHAFLGAARARLPRLQIVAIAGNHDSPARLDATTPLLSALGIDLVGLVPTADPARLLLPLRARDGSVGAWCLAVPYLRPADLPRAPATTAAAAGEEDSYGRGVQVFYTRLHALAQRRRAAGQAIVALGHLHLQGGSTSPLSERRLVVGGAEAVEAAPLAALADYVALGHLHLAQSVGAPHVRYCGSPLPLSFTERDYPHQVLRVDLRGGRLERVEPLRVRQPVPLLRVPATPLPAAAALEALAALPVDAEVQPGLEPFVEAQVLLDRPEPGLAVRIAQALAGKAVRLTRIATFRSEVSATAAATVVSLSELEALTPLGLLSQHYRALHATALPPELARALATLETAVP